MVAWVVGWWFGWQEFLLVAAGCLLAVLIALAFTIGRAQLRVTLGVEPGRVVVGDQAVGQIEVVNSGARRSTPVPLEAPVGAVVARFGAPSLGGGDRWTDVFVIPTVRRSIMPIGPVSSVRGDPLGLARRTVTVSEATQLFVHPRTVRLAGLTAGWIRDLEGRPTNDLSSSDVAFHTLREYVPGDDRRHVHWRTSARLGTLMVRQFVDSRRSLLGLVLSTSRADYANDDEFELAVSVVGSLGVSALVEDQEVAATTGVRPLPSHSPTALLDSLAGVEAVERHSDLTALVKHSKPIVTASSVIALVTGSAVPPGAVRAAADRFHHDVRVLGIRVNPGAEVTVQTIGSNSILELGSLDDLARVVRSTVSR